MEHYKEGIQTSQFIELLPHTDECSAQLCTGIKSNHTYINLLLSCEEDEITKELSYLHVD